MRRLLILIAVLGAMSARSTGSALPLKTRNELKKSLLALVREKDPSRQQELFPYLFIHGRDGVEYLETLREKPGHRDWVDRIVSQAPTRLGLDLAAQEVEAVPVHHPSFASVGEIVLLRRQDQFAGFAASPDCRPEEGTLVLSWWSQRGKVKKLSQAGGEKGELTVRGVPASRPMRPNAGYTEYDYSFEVAGLPVELRYVGPAFFRCRYRDASVSIALSGTDRPARLSSADDTVSFSSAYPEELARIRTRLPEYLFRSIPGCEPLPLEGSEKEQFSQYEMVQVSVRLTRPRGEPIVLVRFLELASIDFRPYHYDYIVSFVNEIAEIPRERVVVLAGSAPGLEGNQFFQEGEWGRPSPALVKLLRAEFPEAY